MNKRGSKKKMQSGYEHEKRTAMTITMMTMTALGIFVFVYLCQTLRAQPLFPFQNENLEWCRTWLYMTVVDFYGSTWALSAIIAWSESPISAVLWILAISLLGSPFACAYVIYRGYKHGTLTLGTTSSTYNGIPSRL